jgi:tetraacyldisaccharide 4'-kinase
VTLSENLQAEWLQRGPLARALFPLSLLYGAVVALRRGLFRIGWKRSERLPVPVVVVGNLIAGGAGKTPTTLALLSLLREQGWNPGIVSRGHGREGSGGREVTRDSNATDTGDEPLLLHLRSGAPMFVDADRVAAARALLQRHPDTDLLLSDDGLQHLRLARDVEVIVFDERGAGNGWLLPAGPLREPVPAAPPARSVVVYNAPALSMAWPGHLAQRGLGGLVTLDAWWAGGAADPSAFELLRGVRLLAVAGIARPQRFFQMLRAVGLRFDELPLSDHHPFEPLPWPEGTADVIVTEKDAVKLRPEAVGATRVWVATLDFSFGPAFANELLALLPPKRPKDSLLH